MIYYQGLFKIWQIRSLNTTMWEELGISSGTVFIILGALYFVIKWEVKNGIKEAYSDITGNSLADNQAKSDISKAPVTEI